jgi:hypothetical protein
LLEIAPVLALKRGDQKNYSNVNPPQALQILVDYINRLTFLSHKLSASLPPLQKTLFVDIVTMIPKQQEFLMPEVPHYEIDEIFHATWQYEYDITYQEFRSRAFALALHVLKAAPKLFISEGKAAELRTIFDAVKIMSMYIKGLVDLKEDLDIYKETQSITSFISRELVDSIPKHEFMI